MGNKGFTLVEVLAVIAIIAIIGAVTTPGILRTLNVGKESSDQILYDNISGALQTMFEEIAYSNISDFNVYTNEGIQEEMVEIKNGNSIETNVQTLVGNGFLNGINNENKSGNNTNSKIVLNSKKEDIGSCKVKITKGTNGNKICYKIEGVSSDEGCPDTNDLGGDSQCN